MMQKVSHPTLITQTCSCFVLLLSGWLLTTNRVSAQNTAPITVQDLYIVEQDQTLTVTAAGGLFSNDYDLDGDSFSITNGILPDNGAVAFSAGDGGFTYTPNAGFTGTDTFGYRVRDTAGNTSGLTTVTVEVLPSPNRAPVAVPDAYTTPFDTPLSVPSTTGLLVNDYDPDGDQLFVGAFTSPANGSVSINISTGALTYTPDPGFTGIDSFQYRIRDPDFAISSLVTVTVEVQAPLNRTPQAFSNFYGTPMDVPLNVSSAAGLLSNDYDPDGDQLFVGAFTSPANGSVSINISTGALTYTPDPGFTGIDSFQYRIRDPDFAISSLVDVLIAVGVNTLLPVELVQFKAVRDGDAVLLTWDTASETNNAGFEIQRAVDGGAFDVLGFVDGSGTTTESQTYTFTDPALPFDAGGLTYRLKQIDYDGTSAYSPLVELDLRTPETFALHENFPNPFTTTTTIRYELPRAAQVRLAVYDVQGREVAVLVEAAQEAGRKAVTFDASSLAGGIYLYRLETDNGFRQTGRMVHTHR